MLTAKQQRFVDEYLIDRNATQAAIRAGYSQATAQEQSSRLLSNVMVREAVQEATESQAERVQIDADRVLTEISRLAFYDVRQLVEVASPAEIAALPEEVRRAVAGWGYDRHGNFTLKMADRLRALDMLARHLGLYHDKIEMTHNHGLAERLERARQRRIDDLPTDD